jgi:hypothetical protein
MTAPREIRTEWAPVGEPVLCMCGHQHYARQEMTAGGVPTQLAPQWNFCEDPDCRCTGLRRQLRGGSDD